MPTSDFLGQAQQLLAPIKWCPRLDTADTPSVRIILRDAIDLSGLRRQADGVGPPTPAQIQELLQLPDTVAAKDMLIKRLALLARRWRRPLAAAVGCVLH